MACGALIALAGCRVTDMRLWRPPQAAPTDCDIDRFPAVAYHDAPGADPLRHRLDLFLPKGKKDYPVVVLVHGGAWMVGDNRCCGLYSSVGEHLARQGIGVALPNYRLSPAVKHPEHVEDVARAFAWVNQNIAKAGGDPQRIYLVGHSAGGHLVSLLATDPQYLRAVGCEVSDIQGVVGISGVYRIPPGSVEVALGGNAGNSLRLDEMAPLRRASASRDAEPASGGLPVRFNIFKAPFGDNAEARRGASPVEHVRPGLPPFLLLCAEHDLPLLTGMAEEMHGVLTKNGVPCRLTTIAQRNHNSILFRAIDRDDPVARAIADFVHSR